MALKQVMICVIDGQGGGIGSTIVKRIKEEFGERVEIIALGTNSIATAAMMKARANRGATGENAIVRMAPQADYIIGPISIVMANAMMGELTPVMAEAIASSPASKMLLPLSQEKVTIIGVTSQPLPHLVEDLIVKELKEKIDV
jgi:NAD(P)-dependent dehydrogenase (short-subunit alcohol dehydrogenase family)